jgi:DNA (cytosine-5)-methyltransferase 1
VTAVPTGRRDRPLLLDLFCGAGGAARGYHDAGFDVVGVDVVPQPNYPYPMVVADATSWPLDGRYDAIHASPPCQDHSPLRHRVGTHGTGWMLAHTLDRLRRCGVPWVVENVMGAPLPSQPTLDGRYGTVVCGASFGLGAAGLDLARHRRFATSFPAYAPPCSHRNGATIAVFGEGTHRRAGGRYAPPATRAEQRVAMGIDWMTRAELVQAIPPAYTAFLGVQLRAACDTHAGVAS